MAETSGQGDELTVAFVAAGVQRFGDAAGLAFELRWQQAEATGTAAEATRAALCAYVAGELVWGDADADGASGFDWPWIELLEHLAVAWRYLEWEESDPLGLGGDPDRLRARVEDGWHDMAEADAAKEDEDLRGFERTHDLSAALRGAWLPPIWLLRRGNTARVVGGSARVTLPLERSLGVVETLGEALARRLDGITDGRAEAAARAWKNRRRVSVDDFTRIATGLSEALLTELRQAAPLRDMFELDKIAPNELLIAARMIGPKIDADEIRSILRQVQGARHTEAADLDRWGEEARALDLRGRQHSQGRILAQWVRDRLSLKDDERVDIDAVLRRLSVVVRPLTASPPRIDAICAWGQRHGPVIFVNKNGPHARGVRGERATLAHELCHLLIDRGTTLPFGEVKGPRSPRDLEARANAFAAALLVPEAAAAAGLRSAGGDPKHAIRRLCQKYDASEAVVAWQALNSRAALPEDVELELRRVAARYGPVPNPG